MNLKKESIVPKESYGQRIDAVLAKLFPEFSRSQLSQWLKEGLITVNQKILKPKDKVMGGEFIILQVTESKAYGSEDMAEAIPLHIIFEDAAFLIINKPAGLVVHPGAGNPEHTLVNALLHHDPQLQQIPRAGIIHRLDKDTTGLLIVAKTVEAHTALIRQMQKREIQRKYLTLVHGHVISGGKIETFYGRHPRNRLKMSVCNQGKEAITEYKVRQQFSQFTLLEVQLETGRTHQIRVHMSHINHPVVGDPLYGGQNRAPVRASSKLQQVLSQFKRQALHAYFLAFTHPMTLEPVMYTAPLPDDFNELLLAL